MRGSKKPKNQKRGRETARPSDRWPSATARPLQPQRSCDECAFAGQPFAPAQAAFLVNGTYLFESDAASISAFGAITTIYICLTLTPPSLTIFFDRGNISGSTLPIVASLANLAIMVNSSSSTTWLHGPSGLRNPHPQPEVCSLIRLPLHFPHAHHHPPPPPRHNPTPTSPPQAPNFNPSFTTRSQRRTATRGKHAAFSCTDTPNRAANCTTHQSWRARRLSS